MVLPLRDDNPTSRTAVVTIALIAINIFVYFVVQPHNGTDAAQSYLYAHAAIPCELSTRQPVTAADVATGRCDINQSVIVNTPTGPQQVPGTPLFPHKNVYLAILISMFLHGSILHVLGNMLFLWVFGNNVEDRLGPFFYLIFYLGTGVIAGLSFILLNLHSVTPIVGASGAIAGVMGAYLIWFPRARVLTILGFFPLYLPAVVVLGLWFVLQFFTNPNEGVAWQAHVGGFLAGALIALLLKPFFGPRRPRAAIPGDDWGGGFRGGYPGRT
ncbi:MAG: putative rane protein [Actinomycetia bacterium]|nr:putative rane protein [Actinomycetes bacterium]